MGIQSASKIGLAIKNVRDEKEKQGSLK